MNLIKSHKKNKITVTLLFILCIFFQLTTKGQMRKIYLDMADSNDVVKKLSFYSASSGFVGFTDWIGFTSDSGHTFIQKYITINNVDFNGYDVNLTFGFGISGVKAFNKDTVIAYGDYGFVPSILYSTDGGNTFKLVFHSQYANIQYTNGIEDMIFPENNNIGFAVDADRVLETTDQGITWVAIRTDPNSYMNYLLATSNNNVFAFSQNYQVSKLIETGDGGITWQQITIPTFANSKIEYVDFISPLKGWINIFDGGGVQNLYYTMDGGTSWVQQNNTDATPFLCQKMKFINDSTGFATEDFFTIYKTTDSGKIWEPLPRDNNFTYLLYTHYDIQFLNSTQFWAGGGHGFLETNTNAGGITLPKAYFNIDTTNFYQSQTVNLLNLSKTGYLYKWFVNNVLIGNSYNTSYLHNNNNTIDTVKLIVTTGLFSDTLVKYYYFNNQPPPPIPVITSFSPTNGTTGTIVTITGINFTGATSVNIGGVPASGFTVTSSTSINATVGAGASGDISVITPYGTAFQAGFTYKTALRITSFSPTSGSAGSTVTIAGSNFSTIPEDNIVYFGAVKATVLSASGSQLTVSVPPGATYLPLSVTVNGLTAYSTLPFVLTFAGGGTITKSLFPAKVDFPADETSLYMANGDFDGDGEPDIVTGNFSYLNRVTLLRDNSTKDSISFDPAEMIQLLPGYNDVWGPVAVIDANGDGKPDIVAANGNNDLSYLKNKSVSGGLNFDPAKSVGGVQTEYITISDFDGDGRPDILCPGPNSPGIRIFQNTTTGGNFSLKDGYTFIYYTGNRLGDVIAGDFDGDGKPDVVTMEYSATYSIDIYKNTTNAGIISFAHPIVMTAGVQFNDLVTGDFDGDGKLDIAATLSNGYVAIYRNTTVNGVLSFAPSVNFPTNYVETSMAVGDLNGDGKPDLAMADWTYESDTSNDIQAVVMENKSTPGNIVFSPEVDFGYTTQNHRSKNLFIADFNGDGIPEIAVENLATHDVSILLRQEGTLAITLLNFSGHLKNNNSNLVWQTASENNTDHFNVQRSKDGIHFSKIGSIQAAGNSNLEKSYSYTDANVTQLHASVLYYRLEEVDNNGKVQISKTVSIKIKNSTSFVLSPNPANDFINVVSSGDIANVTVKVTDMNGRTLYTANQDFIAGEPMQISISKFSKQALIVTIDGNACHEQFKVIKN